MCVRVSLPPRQTRVGVTKGAPHSDRPVPVGSRVSVSLLWHKGGLGVPSRGVFGQHQVPRAHGRGLEIVLVAVNEGVKEKKK